MKLGVVGCNSGNGHCYSWSAIINGFDLGEMRNCEFPRIYEYLKSADYSEMGVLDRCSVEFVWMHSAERAMNVSRMSKVANISDSLDELLSASDAILLTMDDLKERSEIESQILASGKPVFIDKPFSDNEADAKSKFFKDTEGWKIFTTSTLRYADELLLSDEEHESVGDIKRIVAVAPNLWSTYSVHLIDPILNSYYTNQDPILIDRCIKPDSTNILFKLGDIEVDVSCDRKYSGPISIEYEGALGSIRKEFSDPFNCFKKALISAVEQWISKRVSISRNLTILSSRIIAWGLNG